MFSKDLLSWYYSRQRLMPWRGETDPYKIWLSEVMLQQTQVETVKSYYLRWIQTFPTVRSVAKANSDDILKLWEGLGYYSRARNFHKACQVVVDHYGGQVPTDPKVFVSLPGVGDYTTAAVLSIAFNQVIPAIDGNVKRVVARLLALQKSPDKELVRIESFLTSKISKKSPGDFNQAMMDLGSTLCKAQAPMCLICQVSAHCKAFKEGTTHLYPIKNKKKKSPHYHIAVGIVQKGNKVLISKRKAKGMLGGLWEFPGGKIEKKESASACAVREVKEETGVTAKPVSSVGKVRHVYSHFSIEMEAILCEFKKGRARSIECDDCRWVPIEDIKKYAFPKANHKLFSLLNWK